MKDGNCLCAQHVHNHSHQILCATFTQLPLGTEHPDVHRTLVLYRRLDINRVLIRHCQSML